MSLSPDARSEDPEFAWEIARLFPLQGCWSDADYLNLTDETNRLVEFTDGRIEVLEPPTRTHQLMVLFLIDAVRAFAAPRGLGEALVAPLLVRLGDGKFREPDIVFMLARNAHRAGEEFWIGADLVMEVVNRGKKSRERDREEKRRDYAEAGIAEYWIVDPADRSVTVLRLKDDTDKTQTSTGRFEMSTSRTSNRLFDGQARFRTCACRLCYQSSHIAYSSPPRSVSSPMSVCTTSDSWARGTGTTCCGRRSASVCWIGCFSLTSPHTT